MEFPKFSGELIMDVRGLIPSERHGPIRAALKELPPGRTLIVINDHNPQGLFFELEAMPESTGRYDYQTEEKGERCWHAVIKARGA